METKVSRIIMISLDDNDYEELRDSRQPSRYIRQRITNDGMWYIFLDEVQMCKGFESVLNGLNRKENLDIYVTGSNSKNNWSLYRTSSRCFFIS